MRPVDRGKAPSRYSQYADAKQDLANVLGTYCSYCERRIPTNLAVEHIQPKGIPKYAHLECEWTNLLLACVNCNSAKLATDVRTTEFLLPDRDNTFAAFEYLPTGEVILAQSLSATVRRMAQRTLDMTALNRAPESEFDEEVIFSALERIGQRVQAWTQANDALEDFTNGETTAKVIAREATATGHFSIWMKVFECQPTVRTALIVRFAGTARDCFDAKTAPISPRPKNGLSGSGKV